MSGRKVWFITGAGRGMGVDFATAVLAAGDGWLRAARVLTTLLAVSWSVLWAGAASAADATEQAVLAAHEKRRDATLAGDAAAVGSMMTDDLTFTHANAVVETKAEFLDALKTGRYQYKSLTDEERGVRVHGDTESSPGRVALS